MAAKGTLGNGGDAHPAGLQVSELNQRSAPLGVWNVCSFHVREEEWTFKDKATRLDKKGAALKIILVNVRGPSQYATGQLNMVGGNKIPLTRAKDKFQGTGKCFQMSKVQFHAGMKPEYVHTSLKLTVNLGSTKFDPVMQQQDGETIQPEPAMTLSEIKELSSKQRFDVTALVSGMEEPRPQRDDRMVRNITLIDQSAAGDKVQQLSWGFWTAPKPSVSESAMIDILREAVDQKKPLSFFGLEGKQGNNGGYSVSNSKDFFVIVAKGARAKAIEESAEQLRSTPVSDREVLEQGFQPNHVNYDDVAGTEVFCQSLSRVAKPTGIKSIDEGATVWQLNWVEVGWPQGEAADLCTKR